MSFDDIDMSPKPQPSGGEAPPETESEEPPLPPEAEVFDASPAPAETQQPGRA